GDTLALDAIPADSPTRQQGRRNRPMRGALPRPRSVRAAAVCAGLLALVSPASLVAHPSSHASSGAPASAPVAEHAGPTNYDIRWNLAKERAGKTAVSPVRTQAEQRLASRVAGLR